MNRMKRRRLYYRLAAVLLSCFSGTFLLMPVANRVSQRNARIVLVSVGVLSWPAGQIAGWAGRTKGQKEKESSL